MRPVTSAAALDTEPSPTTPTREKAARSTGSTNSRPPLPLDDPRPSEHPRWRWSAREKRWIVYFQGQRWTINKEEDSHVWFLADIHRLNLFTQLTKSLQ
jgi:hypothetical protein